MGVEAEMVAEGSKAHHHAPPWPRLAEAGHGVGHHLGAVGEEVGEGCAQCGQGAALIFGQGGEVEVDGGDMAGAWVAGARTA